MSTQIAYTQDEINELEQMDKHMLHPWDILKLDIPKQLIDHGEGCYVWDIEGNKFFDSLGGLWAVNAGYGHKELVQAAADQMLRMPFYNTFVSNGNVPAARLSAKLAELAPGNLNHVMYTTGGSTANDTAIRVIQHYNYLRGKPEKKHIISRKDAYHGSTHLAIQLIGKEPDRIGFNFDIPWVHHVKGPNLYRREEGTTEAEWLEILAKDLEDKILEIGEDKVAAFFAEPIMAAGGVKFAPEGYHVRMHEICKKYDILWVSDEVVTGFGRLGHWFAVKDVFGVQPDIITCAKGLTSGYIPLGAAIFSDEIYEVIASDPEQMLSNGFTYGGTPPACAVALANIQLMEDKKIFENVKEVGPYFEEQMKTLSDLPMVGDVRGMLMLHGLEFVKNKETKELFPTDLDVGEEVVGACKKRGVLVRPIGPLNVISPPCCMTKEDVDFFVKVMRESILEVAEKYCQEGHL